MKDNERNETFSDLEIPVPMRTDPKKEIHTGKFMTASGDKSFPKHEPSTTKPFTGTKGVIHGIDKINPEDIPWVGKR
jgi:hypothetical protein